MRELVELFRHNLWANLKLLDAVESADARLLDRGEPAPRDLRTDYGGRAYEIDPVVVFVQAISHATEPRAHVVTTLSAHGLEPVPLDAWTWGRGDRRASDGLTSLSSGSAEGEGFEPPDGSRRLRFSRPVHSSALPTLRAHRVPAGPSDNLGGGFKPRSGECPDR